MNAPSLDPEEPFWQQIQEQPINPLPRLLYADWCDENDRPVMAIVQRWLAATGRRPMTWRNQGWIWISEKSVQEFRIEKSRTIPNQLLGAIPSDSPGLVGSPVKGYWVFESWRLAEEALVAAWVRATQKHFLWANWEPDFTPVKGLIYPTSFKHISAPNQSRERGFKVISMGCLIYIVVGALVAIGLSCFGLNSPRFQVNPIPPFELSPEMREELKPSKKNR